MNVARFLLTEGADTDKANASNGGGQEGQSEEQQEAEGKRAGEAHPTTGNTTRGITHIIIIIISSSSSSSSSTTTTTGITTPATEEADAALRAALESYEDLDALVAAINAHVDDASPELLKEARVTRDMIEKYRKKALKQEKR